MDGEIDMNGGRGADDRNSGTYSAAGGGAGGSILIAAKGTFSGTGSLSAKGGDGGRAWKGGGGGGGGGRIAIHFGTRTNSKLINMTVRGGNCSYCVLFWEASTSAMGPAGGAGTVYIRDMTENTTELIVDNEGLKQPRMDGRPYRAREGSCRCCNISYDGDSDSTSSSQLPCALLATPLWDFLRVWLLTIHAL